MKLDSGRYSVNPTPKPIGLFFPRVKRNVIFFFLAVLSAVNSQPTPEVCSCAPTVYQWLLDYSLSCPPADVKQGTISGISETVCYIRPESSTVTDLKPIKTTLIQIFELDLNLVAVKTSVLPNLSLSNGDKFSFTSIVATEPQKIPGGLQMHIVSENTNGDIIYNDWIVRFTNYCNVEPFTTQDSLGWAVFYKVAPPRPQLCSTGIPTDSLSPTLSPIQPTRPPLKPTKQPVVDTSPPTQIPYRTSRPSLTPVVSPIQPTRTPLKPTKQPVVDTPPPTQVPNTTSRPTQYASNPTRSPLKATKHPKMYTSSPTQQTARPTNSQNTQTASPLKPTNHPLMDASSSPMPTPIETSRPIAHSPKTTRSPLKPTKRPQNLTLSPTNQQLTLSPTKHQLTSYPAPQSVASVSYSFSFSYRLRTSRKKINDYDILEEHWWHVKHASQNYDIHKVLANEIAVSSAISETIPGLSKSSKQTKSKKITRRRVLS